MCISLCKESPKKGLAEVTPNSKRGCTDILFLLVFVFAWVVILQFVSNAAGQGGDPDKLIRGVDMWGRICGVDAGVEDQPYAMWPNPLYYEPKRCVKSCAETNFINSTSMFVPYPTEEYVYYCLPSANGNFTLDGFQSSANAASRGVADLYGAWSLILLSAFISLCVTYLMLGLLQKMAGLLVLVGLIIIIVGGFLFGYALVTYGTDPLYNSNLSTDEALAAEVMGYIVFTATCLFILVLFFLRKRILIAVNIVEEASIAVNDMKMILLFPIVPFLIFCGYGAFWLAGALWIWSVSNLVEQPTPTAVTYNLLGIRTDNPDVMQRFEIDEEWRNAAVFHFFHLLWDIQFLVYFNFLVAAGATADWYFTRRDADGNKKRGDGEGELTKFPVKAACWRTTRFHLGTVALCSLIIAIIQFIRACVEYIERRSNQEGNKLQKALFCCIKCCLHCLECCMDKINKNALIWTAVYGDNFGTAACSSFQLLWSNMGRVAAINVVSSILIAMTKVAIALLTTGLCALLLQNVETWSSQVSSITGPCMFIFVLSYVTASLFMTTFTAVIDSVFLCFLIDADVNAANGGGDNVEMFASDDLRKLIGKYEESSQKMAAEQEAVRARRPGQQDDDDAVHVQPQGVVPQETK